MVKKYTVIDLFAGAGGFGLGFSMASFNLLLSLEKDKWAVDTLRHNNPDHLVIQDDIRSYKTNNEILNIVKSPPDVIIGGPPCQGFSLAGPSKDPKDPRNSLFRYFARWVSVIQPKVFVMENVTGLLHRKNANGDKVLDIIQADFRSKGYHTEVWQLNAANYGVPQLRNRIFIVGNLFNKKIGAPPQSHYTTAPINVNNLLPAVTVWDAISDLPKIEAGEGIEYMPYTENSISTYQEWARLNSELVSNHVAMKHTKRLINRFKSIQEGTDRDELPEELKVRKRNGNGKISEISYQSNYRHLKPQAISYTIPASFYSNFIHPTIPRNLTSREAARIQSFPDNYVFQGKRTMISSKLLKKLGKEDLDHLSQYNQIGNAVPPLLSKAIATHIRAFLNVNT
ncbi:DNA (cytosine-5)-methyltransferase 1 [Mucilaginibacter sp. OAE612]|uniref:DNA cytosine methyltransferase n=1 Tax=Mucilaginibacter sp. OAE612 TaxID=3156444 RepID=UPI00359D2655